MARISAYEASDGSLHRDRKAYIRHESNLIAAKKIAALVEAQVAIKAAQVGVETISLTGPVAIATFITENQNELREILSFTFKPGADSGDDGHGDDANAGADSTATATTTTATTTTAATAADGSADNSSATTATPATTPATAPVSGDDTEI